MKKMNITEEEKLKLKEKKRLEKNQFQLWRKNVNTHPFILKHHGILVDTRLYYFYKIVAFLFIFILLIIILPMIPINPLIDWAKNLNLTLKNIPLNLTGNLS